MSDDLSLRAQLFIAMGKLKRLTEQLPSNGELGKAIEALDALVRTTTNTAIFPTGEIVYHPKRGTTYRVYGTAHLNSALEAEVTLSPFSTSPTETRKVAFDRDELVLYADVSTGAISTRPTPEFRDGRFIRATELPAIRKPPGV